MWTTASTIESYMLMLLTLATLCLMLMTLVTTSRLAGKDARFQDMQLNKGVAFVLALLTLCQFFFALTYLLLVQAESINIHFETHLFNAIRSAECGGLHILID